MAGYIAYIISKLLSTRICLQEQQKGCIRPLGLSEENMEVYSREGIWTVLTVTFIETKKTIGKQMVLRALEQLVNKYPVLRLKIKTIGEKMFWKEMDHVTPAFDTNETGDWISCFEEYSKTVFDSENGPLWKCVLISNVDSSHHDKTHFSHQYALLFLFHHGILDGMSNLIILNDMQQILNAIMRDETILDAQEKYPASSIAKPLEFYLKDDDFSFTQKLLELGLSLPGISFLITKLATRNIVQSMKQESLFVKHLGVPKTTKKYTSVCQIPFSKEETENIVFACRHHDVTVQCALQTASAMALCKTLKNPHLSSDTESLASAQIVDVGCTVNMKNLLPEIPKDDLGVFISMLSTKLEIKEDSNFWILAAETKSQLRQDPLAAATSFTKNAVHWGRKVGVNLVKELSPPPYYGRYPGLQLFYSNLGNCAHLNMDNSAMARINGYVSGTSEHLLGGLGLHSAVTFLNRLNWNFTYYPNIHHQKVVDFYAKETKRIITSAVNYDK